MILISFWLFLDVVVSLAVHVAIEITGDTSLGHTSAILVIKNLLGDRADLTPQPPLLTRRKGSQSQRAR